MTQCFTYLSNCQLFVKPHTTAALTTYTSLQNKSPPETQNITMKDLRSATLHASVREKFPAQKYKASIVSTRAALLQILLVLRYSHDLPRSHMADML
jgi:hypothetical protein